LPEEAVFIFMLLCLIAGAAFCIYRLPSYRLTYPEPEKEIGLLYKAQSRPDVPLYQMLNWVPTETINFYGDTHATVLNPGTVGGETIHGPFYIVVKPIMVTYFFKRNINDPINPGLQLISLQSSYAFIYSDRDLQMPVFKFQ
jgi:hypothetical protein